MSSDRTKPKSDRERYEIHSSLIWVKGQLRQHHKWLMWGTKFRVTELSTYFDFSLSIRLLFLVASKSAGISVYHNHDSFVFTSGFFWFDIYNSYNISNWHSCTDNLRSYKTSFYYMYDFCTNKSRKWIKHSLIYRFKPSRADLASV